MIFERDEREQKLIEKLRKRRYRSAYVGEQVRRGIANQIRALREHPSRSWKQGELSKRLGKPQSVVSRMEDPSYGKLTVQTLLEVAEVFDVALSVQFVNFPTFIARTRDVSEDAMQAESFEQSEASGALAKPEKLFSADRSSVLSAVSLERAFNQPRWTLLPDDTPLAAKAPSRKKSAPDLVPIQTDQTIEAFQSAWAAALTEWLEPHRVFTFVAGDIRGNNRPRH